MRRRAGDGGLKHRVRRTIRPPEKHMSDSLPSVRVAPAVTQGQTRRVTATGWEALPAQSCLPWPNPRVSISQCGRSPRVLRRVALILKVCSFLGPRVACRSSQARPSRLSLQCRGTLARLLIWVPFLRSGRALIPSQNLRGSADAKALAGYAHCFLTV